MFGKSYFGGGYWGGGFFGPSGGVVAFSGPLDWPTDIVVRTLDFRLQKNTTRNISPLTRSSQILHRQGRRYVGQFSFRVVGRAAGQRFIALLEKGETFLMHDQSRPEPINGTVTGVLLNGAALRGATTIPVDGLGLPLSQPKLKAGDLVGIGGKLYGLEDDVAANASGQGTFHLNRGLLVAAADNAVVTLTRPTCEMMLSDDDQNSAPIDFMKVYDFSLSMIEVL